MHLDALDQFVKHKLRVKYYIRYVDDFVLLAESPQQLNIWHDQIEAFLIDKLHARLNPSKTVLQPIARGIDFVGQVILPHRRVTRPRTVETALRQVSNVPAEQLRETANSYFGLLDQASHSHNARRKLARVVQKRGRAVAADLRKTFKGAA